MEMRAAEISEIIKQQIADYNREVEVNETGVVLSCGDGIARIYGLDKAAAGELLQFPHDIFGMVLNLERTTSAPFCSARRERSAKVTRSDARAASPRSRSVRATRSS